MEPPAPRALLLLAEIPSPLASMGHTPDTHGLALGGGEFLHAGDLGCCPREAGWKVLERQVRQAVGQAYHSGETKPQVLRRRQSELSGLQSLLFAERCGEGRKPENKVPEALHFQETWRASLDPPRVPSDSGCRWEHRAGLTPQTRSLP